MSLREQAVTDVKHILENPLDFGQVVTLTDPAGVATVLAGHTGDIARAIDPDSGLIIKGRSIHVTLAIPSLPAGPRPEVSTDPVANNPWRVSFPRITTAVVTQYAVVGTDPNDSLGHIVLELGNLRI